MHRTLLDVYKLRDIVPKKVKRNKYKEWDLDQVLNGLLNKWRDTHSSLFEGHPLTLTKSMDNQNSDESLYIKIDRTSNYKDVKGYMNVEIGTVLKETKPKFAISGYPYPKFIQNGYNAIVLTLKGWKIIREKQLYTV